jgi:hypothetical protein
VGERFNPEGELLINDPPISGLENNSTSEDGIAQGVAHGYESSSVTTKRG